MVDACTFVDVGLWFMYDVLCTTDGGILILDDCVWLADDV
jgi:hypothetical protein